MNLFNFKVIPRVRSFYVFVFVLRNLKFKIDKFSLIRKYYQLNFYSTYNLAFKTQFYKLFERLGLISLQVIEHLVNATT